MKFSFVLLSFFGASAIAAAEPTLTKEMGCQMRLHFAQMGAGEAKQALDALGWQYDTHLKNNEDLLKKEVPIGYRDSKEAFLQYAVFWLSVNLELKQGMKPGESSRDFYFVDEYGVWKGKFPETYRITQDGVSEMRQAVQFNHPMTRQKVHLNYFTGPDAGPKGVHVQYGRFEGRNYTPVSVSLVTGPEAEAYVSETLKKLIQTRLKQALGGLGHPDMLKYVTEALVHCTSIKRPEILQAVRGALREIRDYALEKHQAKKPSGTTTH